MAVESATAGYTVAFRRSRQLWGATLEGPLAEAPVRVLVCGRFHVFELLRLARAEADVSVIVAAPFAEIPPAQPDPEARGFWSRPDEEDPEPILASC